MKPAQLNPSILASLPGPILVIGAGGFIGANLFRYLSTCREDVYGTLGRAGINWRLEGLPTNRLVHIDLLDQKSSQQALHRIQAQTIFYLAAYGAYSFENDLEKIYKTNVLALANLFEYLTKHPCHALIHAGSSSEYGLNSSGPHESAERTPNSHYAVTKSAAADLISYFGKVREVPCANLRLYSVYGPYEDTSRLFPMLILQGLNRKLPPFVHPDTSRDFIHVEDVCKAFVLAASKMNPTIRGNSYNIGTGKNTTIRELAELARKEFKIEEPAQFGRMNPRSWDLKDWYANTKQAEQDLGWCDPMPLLEGFQKTQVWWASFLTEKKDLSAASKMTPRSKNSLSAIIACYKDAQAIPIMYERLVATFRKIGIDYQIIFVNDCSPDNSSEAIREISARDANVLGITHSRNFGSQAAFRSGMELAHTEACVLLDGDLQDPPELIESFVEKWREGWEVVYGRRIKREMSSWLEAVYKLFYIIFDRLSFISIPKNAGDFSLIDRRVMKYMLDCQEKDSFLRGLRAYVGFKQIGVDYIRPERLFGVSTNNLLKNINWAKKGIFSFSSIPLDCITLFGGVAFVGSFALMLVLFFAKLFIPSISPSGFTTVLLFLLFFGSTNLFAIGILGEYLGKIIQEVKGRPSFIRSALIKNGDIQKTE